MDIHWQIHYKELALATSHSCGGYKCKPLAWDSTWRPKSVAARWSLRTVCWQTPLCIGRPVFWSTGVFNWLNGAHPCYGGQSRLNFCNWSVVVLQCRAQQRASATCVHVSSPWISFPFRSRQCWVQFPVLHSGFSLVTCFIHNSVYMPIPISQSILPRLSLLVAVHLFSTNPDLNINLIPKHPPSQHKINVDIPIQWKKSYQTFRKAR